MFSGIVIIELVVTSKLIEPIKFHPVVTSIVSSIIGMPSRAISCVDGNFNQYPIPLVIVSFST